MKHQDFLVIGSGIAGLMFALDVAKCGSVTILCKSEPCEGATKYAQGGIAAVISPLDSCESHIADTLNAGAGLCHEEVVHYVVSHGLEAISRLVELGISFDKKSLSQSFELAKEGGHSARRILHYRDETGAEIQRALLERVKAEPNIEILPHHIAIDLIAKDSHDGSFPEIIGAYALDKSSSKITGFVSRVTMLATGGAGKVYLYTTNPNVSTGDGIAMAYRAGARIANMEFFQFHPTCLYHNKARSLLITEAIRGEGARLLNIKGEAFMQRYDERGELAPRDIVARAIDAEMKRTGADNVLLDISHREASFIRSRFPMIYAKTLECGIDITKEPIPVVPAAHYCCGGVMADLNGRTDLPRLYAAGETASTGLHGANRLASNSLLEAAVFARAAARDCSNRIKDLSLEQNVPEWDYLDSVETREHIIVNHVWQEVRRMMWNLVGIVRSNMRLELASKRIQAVQKEIRDYYWKYFVTSDLIELRNIITVSDLIISMAKSRKESRGLHYNIDYPEKDDAKWLRDSVMQQEP